MIELRGGMYVVVPQSLRALSRELAGGESTAEQLESLVDELLGQLTVFHRALRGHVLAELEERERETTRRLRRLGGP